MGKFIFPFPQSHPSVTAPGVNFSKPFCGEYEKAQSPWRFPFLLGIGLPLQGRAHPWTPVTPLPPQKQVILNRWSVLLPYETIYFGDSPAHFWHPPSFCRGELRQGLAIEHPCPYQQFCSLLIPLRSLFLSRFSQRLQMLQLLLNLLLKKRHLLKPKLGLCHL